MSVVHNFVRVQWTQAARRSFMIATFFSIFSLFAASVAAEPKRVPCTTQLPQKQAFFGDLHVHTRYSLDASTQGTRTTPAQAYQFARGDRIGIQPWTQDGIAQRSSAIVQAAGFCHGVGSRRINWRSLYVQYARV